MLLIMLLDLNPTSNVARSLIKFDQDQINDVLDTIASVTESLSISASLRSLCS
jgi:L-fucose mutarotase/ribose pyranase (RbsD/FucU family)